MKGKLYTRRESLIGVGAAAAGLLTWSAVPRLAAAGPPAAPANRVLRVAHLTDIHVQPERRATDGLIACLHHVQQLADQPDLIITGGDSVMDSLGADDARTQLQWDLWKSALKNECSLPVRCCIGNHDVWGWEKAKSGTTGDEPLWGKKRAVAMLGLENRYYRFSQAGWQFIVLDSTHALSGGRDGYTARLDDEQFDWLAATLRDAPAEQPIMIVSHIPIFSVTPLVWDSNERGDTVVSGALLHTDRLKLKNLFAHHPNVKLCVSGHMHLLDRVDYNGVSYFCNGAVCGNWWSGRHIDCDEGYALIDLYDDGSSACHYVKYGWKAAV